MDSNFLKDVATYLATVLVQSGAVPAPRSNEEACHLLDACLRGFVDYMRKAGQVIEMNAQGSSALN
jgi:hypothetical protein